MIIWFSLAGISTLLVFFLSLRYPLYFQAHKRITLVVWLYWISIIISPLYYEFPRVFGDVVTFEQNKIVRHPFGTFCWDDCLIIPKQEIGIVSGVTSITQNPKVRKIQYYVDVKITNPELFYSNPYHRLNTKDFDQKIFLFDHEDLTLPDSVESLIGKIVLNKLFVFNAERSVELAAFFNPLDYDQNARMKIMIESALNPSLEAEYGLKVTFYRFTVE